MTMQPANVATAVSSDLATDALGRLVAVLAEDAMFALAAGGGDAEGALEGLGKRREPAYNAILQGMPVARMSDQLDAWIVQLARAMAPIAPPAWLPMMDVVREKVTLEIGARGLRSLFSTKPSDKDVVRVTKIGKLAVRFLRAVFAADAPLQEEEATTIAAVIASLGLPEAEATSLYNEQIMAVDRIDFFGDLEPAVSRALLRGAWLAAAWDTIDPREEKVIRFAAHKLNVVDTDVEAARAEAQHRVDGRRVTGLAAVDGIRFVLSDRQPGTGVTVAALVGTLMLPRRYREEALAPIGHGAPVTLAKRYESLASDEKIAVLGMAWAAALLENPTLGRRALLGVRWERFAADIGDDGARGRALVDHFVNDTLATIARNLK